MHSDVRGNGPSPGLGEVGFGPGRENTDLFGLIVACFWAYLVGLLGCLSSRHVCSRQQQKHEPVGLATVRVNA